MSPVEGGLDGGEPPPVEVIDQGTQGTQRTRARRRAHGRIQRAIRSSRRARMTGWTAPLAGCARATHVSCMMQSQTKTELVGFMELQVGSMAVQVPIRTADPVPSLPLASFEVEGETCVILIRGDSSSKAVERAMGEAARQAVAHLSRKLLN